MISCKRVISIPKMLHAVGLASSRTEAERLIKAGAVEIEGHRVTGHVWYIFDVDGKEGYAFGA